MHAKAFRPPAVPLVCHDPYFSVWSAADRLADGFTVHWTGEQHPLSALIRIDGKTWRLMGAPIDGLPVLEQESLEVLPTRTRYVFRHPAIRLELSFLTPCMPHDLEHYSWPLTYLVWTVASLDGRAHEVQAYFDAFADLAVDSWERSVSWARFRLSRLDVLRIGSFRQPVLERPGDFTRIDWGYLYLAAPRQDGISTCLCPAGLGAASFAAGGSLPADDDLAMPRQVRLHRRDWKSTPVLACALDFGPVDAGPRTRFLMLAYDQLWTVEYFQRRLRPYWRRGGREIDALLETARAEFEELERTCAAYDRELMRELESAGGPLYAALAALAFRQCAAGHSLAADMNGRPLHFSKENSSNGCIATVDVTYPAAPFFLLLNPELLEAQLLPILEYASSPLWPHPFAPHDIGTHPQANGQVYRGGVHTSEQMPVEECGNMLLLVAAHARTRPDSDLAVRFRPVLETWADYLVENGYDPALQLCTDDFAGPMPRNANLSLKAILALAAYGRLSAGLGRTAQAERYRGAARSMASHWQVDADQGDHSSLAFGAAGGWSLKYNLVWDTVLGLDIFPPEIRRRELAFYAGKMKHYGVPLDGRADYTKLDWLAWVAAMGGSNEERRAILEALYRFADETPDRVPLSDWYGSSTARCEHFKARPVVGGLFMPLLTDARTWDIWSRRAAADRSKSTPAAR